MKINFVFTTYFFSSRKLNYSQDELDKRLHVKGKVLHSMGMLKY